eukprot:TRINITY_DN68054_c0_g1_i1.p1 TRINITY_DN68054_c0_g1~~TRINITY_DN68054_c0_g1_i1.p1  ORF type:complete len:168 (-),score=35.38 TRINITY_DN68054_c0_g1_i1:545-1048(-)
MSDDASRLYLCFSKYFYQGYLKVVEASNAGAFHVKTPYELLTSIAWFQEASSRVFGCACVSLLQCELQWTGAGRGVIMGHTVMFELYTKFDKKAKDHLKGDMAVATDASARWLDDTDNDNFEADLEMIMEMDEPSRNSSEDDADATTEPEVASNGVATCFSSIRAFS